PKLRRSTSTGSKQGSEYNEDIYLIGSVTDGSGSIPVKALLDTGCQVNMLDSNTLDKLPDAKRKDLSPPIKVSYDGVIETHSVAYEVTLKASNVSTAEAVIAPISVIKSSIIPNEQMVIGSRWCLETGIVKTLIGERHVDDIPDEDDVMFMR
ncbi:hypothetical protein ADUPG1_005004, partial [Aduncisulcus paluster]